MVESDRSSGQEFFSSKNLKSGYNPGIVVVLVVVGLVLAFLIGNYYLYAYAHKAHPARKKKPVSKKKLRRERLKQGMGPVGD